MKRRITRLLLCLFMLTMVGVAWPAAAAAEDFTVHVPVNITNVPSAFADKLYLRISIWDASGGTEVAYATSIFPFRTGNTSAL